MAATMLNPRSDRPPSQNPLNNGRLVCEWKQTADGRMTCTWTLRDATLASVPELSPEEMTLEPDVPTSKDRTTIGGQDRFLVWILRPPHQVRTILGMAAAVVFLGLAAADLSSSTTVNSHQTSQVSVATTRVVPAVAQSAMMDNVPSLIDPDTEFFLGAADGSVGAWIRPATLRPQNR
jgi:hypothetical protein